MMNNVVLIPKFKSKAKINKVYNVNRINKMGENANEFMYEKVSEKREMKNIWIFNHYEITPDLPGGTRHFEIVHNFNFVWIKKYIIGK